ncbi:MAG: UDP binding domain-containing protein [Nitrososphaeria archaeon]
MKSPKSKVSMHYRLADAFAAATAKVLKSKPIDHHIIKTARKINDQMPNHIVKLITKALKNAGKTVKNSRIAILGTAYKANVDDSRLSPDKPIIRKLISLNAPVTVYDPTELKNLNLPEIKKLMASKPSIIDGRRALNPKEADKLGFLCYGVGFGK